MFNIVTSQLPRKGLSIEGVTISTGNVNAEVEMGTPFSQCTCDRTSFRAFPDSGLVSVPGDVAATIYRSVPGAILDARDFSGYYRVCQYSTIALRLL